MPKGKSDALKEHYRELKELNEKGYGSLELAQFMDSLDLFMGQVNKKRTAKDSTVNQNEKNQLLALYSDMQKKGNECFKDPRIKGGHQDIREVMFLLSDVGGSLKTYDPDKGEKTMGELLNPAPEKERATQQQNAANAERPAPIEQPERFDRGTVEGLEQEAAASKQMRKLLGDNSKRMRSSDQYRKIENALERYIKLQEKCAARLGKHGLNENFAPDYINDEDYRQMNEALETLSTEAEKYDREKDALYKTRKASPYEQGRHDAVKAVLQFAKGRMGLTEAEHETRRAAVTVEDRHRFLAQDGKPVSHMVEDKVVDIYRPDPKFSEKETKGADPGYTQEQFDSLTVIENDYRVGNGMVTDEEFASLGVLATLDKNIGGKETWSSRGKFEIEPDQEVAVGNISHYVMDLGQNGEKVRAESGQDFAGVTNVARLQAKKALDAYQKGDKKPLAKLIGHGVDTVVNQLSHAPDKAETYMRNQDNDALNRFVFRAVDLAKRDPELSRLAEKQGMTKDNLRRVEGLRRLDKMACMSIAAQEKLRQGGLSPEEKAECVDAVLRFNLTNAVSYAEYDEKRNSQKAEDHQAEHDETVNDYFVKAMQAEEKGDKQAAREMNKKIAILNNKNMAFIGKLVGATKPIEELGKNINSADITLSKLLPNKQALLEIKDPEKLIETLNDPELFAPPTKGHMKYELYHRQPQQPQAEPELEQQEEELLVGG